jgi:hypothetical protein
MQLADAREIGENPHGASKQLLADSSHRPRRTCSTSIRASDRTRRKKRGWIDIRLPVIRPEWSLHRGTRRQTLGDEAGCCPECRLDILRFQRAAYA